MLLYKDYYNFDLQKCIDQIDLSQVVTRMRYLVMVIDCFGRDGYHHSYKVLIFKQKGWPDDWWPMMDIIILFIDLSRLVSTHKVAIE